MAWIVTKYFLTAAVVVLVSELAKRSDKLGGFVAAEANHTKDKRMRKELDRLFDRIQTTLDSYTDEPIIN